MVAPHYSYLIVKSQIIRILFTLQRQPAIIYNPSQFLSHINPSFSLLAPSISSKSSISCNGFHSVLNSALFSGGANLLSSARLISFRLRLAICFIFKVGRKNCYTYPEDERRPKIPGPCHQE